MQSCALDKSKKKMWGFVISYAAAHLILPNGQRSGVATNLTVSEYEDKEEFSKIYTRAICITASVLIQ